MTQKVIFLKTTDSSPWTVPGDCTSIDSVELIGAGQHGFTGSKATGTGGTGGSYTRKNTITPGATVNFGVGVASSVSGAAGGDTWFGGTSVADALAVAPGGNSSTTWVGDSNNIGGQGALAGGGGGAGGPNGNGGLASSVTGATGDNGHGGIHGADGAEWTQTSDSATAGSGGGGNAGLGTAGQNGGQAGGGGGGGAVGFAGGKGGDGLIVITYTPPTARNASLNVTLDDCASTAAAMVVVAAALGVTLAACTLAGTSGVLAQATLTKTLDDVLAAGVAQDLVQASLNATLAPVTIAANGTVIVNAQAAAALDACTLAGASGVLAEATLTKTLDDVLAAGVAQDLVQASLAVTLADATIAAQGNSIVSAQAMPTLAPVSLAANGTVIVNAQVDATLATATLSAPVTVADSEALNVTLAPATLSAQAKVIPFAEPDLNPPPARPGSLCAAQPAPLRCPTLIESMLATAALLPHGDAWPANDGGGILARFLNWLAPYAGAAVVPQPTKRVAPIGSSTTPVIVPAGHDPVFFDVQAGLPIEAGYRVKLVSHSSAEWIEALVESYAAFALVVTPLAVSHAGIGPYTDWDLYRLTAFDDAEEPSPGGLPPPTVWPAGFVQTGFYAAIGVVRNFLETRLCDLRREFWCATHSETHDLWMAEYGLPDDCDPFPDLCTKVRALGGATCNYFNSIIGRLGWHAICGDRDTIITTSPTEQTISAGPDPVTFVVPSGLPLLGLRLRFTSRATGKWMEGEATDYAGTSLTLTPDAASDVGAGPYTDWDVTADDNLMIAVITGDPIVQPSVEEFFKPFRTGRMRTGHRPTCFIADHPSTHPVYCLIERISPAHVALFYAS